MGVRASRKSMMSVGRCREGDVGVWMGASEHRESGDRGGLRRSDGVESALRAVVTEERGGLERKETRLLGNDEELGLVQGGDRLVTAFLSVC